MRVRIRHTTRFRYGEPAPARSTSCGSPRATTSTRTCSASSSPCSRRRARCRYRDHFGTTVHAFNIWAPHDELVIVGESTVMTYPRPAVPPGGGDLTQLGDPALRDSHAEWLHPSPLASGGDQLATFSQHIQQVVHPQSVLAWYRRRARGARALHLRVRRELRLLDRRRPARPGHRRLPGLRAPVHRDAARPRRTGALRLRLLLRRPGPRDRRRRSRSSRTRGSRRSSPATAGSRSTRRTTAWPTSAMSSSRSAATTPTSRRCAGVMTGGSARCSTSA